MAADIEIRELRKTYARFVALDSVSLTIAGGEFLTLLGPSGSGKTTLLMCIAGFIRPDRGSIRVGGHEMITLHPSQRNIGMVFQNYALFPHMTVGENVAYPLKLRGVSRANRDARATQALKGVQLENMSERHIDQLSGGQRQRVALARALVFEPSIILMDEPLSALDKKLREEMQMELRDLHARLSQTIVYVTHDQTEALTMSDRIAVMKQGHLEQVASPREVYENPASRFVAEFLGNSFFIPVSSLAEDAKAMVGKASFGCLRNPLIVLRPEKLELASSSDSRDGYIHFDGVVEDMVFQGETLSLFVTLIDKSRIHIKLGSRHQTHQQIPKQGSSLRLALHKSDIAIVEG